MSDTYEYAGPEPGSVPQKKPWHSGWCGPGPCRDGSTDGLKHCGYVAENGALAPTRFLYCSCACHAEHRQEGDPLFGGETFRK